MSFEVLKVNKSFFGEGNHSLGAIYFKISKDDLGYYIEAVDKSGKEVNHDYRYYSGYTKRLLQKISTDKSDLSFDWEKITASSFYLCKHDYFLDICQEAYLSSELKGYIVNDTMLPLSFVDKKASINLQLSLVDNEKASENKTIQSKIFLEHDGSFLRNLISYLNHMLSLISQYIK